MNEQTRSAKVPLSQAPAKKKLAVAIPGALVFAVLWQLRIMTPVTRFLALALAAYASIGVLELLFGTSLTNAARQWDNLPGWKKFLISLLVIVIALLGFMSLIPVVARFI